LQKDWRVEAVANACRNLLSASLEGCQFERSIIHFIVTRNPTLVSVNFSGLLAVTNSTLRMLAQSCSQLEVLNVSFCTNADARGLRKVIEGCQNLRELRACELNINDMNFMSALFKNNTVERLYLADSIGVTDEFIRLLVEGVVPELDPFTNQNLAPPRKLSHLDLGNCRLLTDAALRHLADHVPNLTGLTLGGIASLTDAGFAILIPTVPKLTHLDVEDCSELTNATLMNLARNAAAKTLRHLQVSYCENLDDVGMMEILRKCEKLRILEMDSSTFAFPSVLLILN
jgi:F-box/leucine-rich repeat protein 2/20